MGRGIGGLGWGGGLMMGMLLRGGEGMRLLSLLGPRVHRLPCVCVCVCVCACVLWRFRG